MVPDPELHLPSPTSRRTLLVAEISANHGGRIEGAVDAVRAAAAAGADAIKIQSYTADSLTIASDRAEFRIAAGPWAGETLHELYRRAQTPVEWFPVLRREATGLGVPLFSTPFDAGGVAYLAAHGATAFKIASFELVDLELVAGIAATGRPVIASTGLASREEIAEAVAVIRRVWGDRDPGLALLHCVSAYPAPAAEMNLATIRDLAASFGAVPGLSDHTLGTTVAVAAVALGARVIEKHFTVSRAAGGPDSRFSIEPAEFRHMVESVRIVEAAVGGVAYGPTAAEKANLRFRRSIFAVRAIAAGETLTRDNVRVIRPGHGLPPRHLPEILGRVAARACAAGTPIQWDLLR